MSQLNRATIMVAATVTALLALSLGPAVAQDEEVAGEEPGTTTPAGEMEAGLWVSDAWTRESPMLALAAAAYLVIHNDTDADDALVGASSPAAENVELHLSSMDEEGLMSMSPVAEIPIPAQAAATLEPGGYHIMLIDLVEPLVADDEIALELTFRDAEPLVVSAPVLAVAPMAVDTSDDMDMGDEAMPADDED